MVGYMEKCKFACTRIKFFGHIVCPEGVLPDPSKVEAVVNMTAPITVTDLCRFMGMVNQLGKFTPDIAEVSQPLRELLAKNRVWTWDPVKSMPSKRSKKLLN